MYIIWLWAPLSKSKDWVYQHKIYLANWVSVSLSSRDANAYKNLYELASGGCPFGGATLRAECWIEYQLTQFALHLLALRQGWSMPHIEDSNIFEIYPSIFNCYSYIYIYHSPICWWCYVILRLDISLPLLGLKKHWDQTFTLRSSALEISQTGIWRSPQRITLA